MITVSMGLDTGLSSQRLWFDRAVRAEFDDPAAYDNYIWAIGPGWHGSHQLMHQFGVVCLNPCRDIPRRKTTASPLDCESPGPFGPIKTVSRFVTDG